MKKQTAALCVQSEGAVISRRADPLSDVALIPRKTNWTQQGGAEETNVP